MNHSETFTLNYRVLFRGAFSQITWNIEKVFCVKMECKLNLFSPSATIRWNNNNPNPLLEWIIENGHNLQYEDGISSRNNFQHRFSLCSSKTWDFLNFPHLSWITRVSFIWCIPLERETFTSTLNSCHVYLQYLVSLLQDLV